MGIGRFWGFAAFGGQFYRCPNDSHVTRNESGVATSMIVLVSVQDSLFDEVSSTVATVFTLILVVFTWVGGAIANAIYSVDDAFDPWTHAAAIVKSIPRVWPASRCF